MKSVGFAFTLLYTKHMQDELRYAVGIDIGTNIVRALVGAIDNAGKITIIGYNEQPSSGMRKGTIVDANKTAQVVDKALVAVDEMSDYHVHRATVGINGSHIQGFGSRGVIAVGSQNREVSPDDIARVQGTATEVQMPANREILDITPRSYVLDDQKGIKDPIGLSGIRLEVDAYIITALIPHVKNIESILDLNQIADRMIVPVGLASSRAVLTEQQKEHGVVHIDIGGSTTNIAVYDEGDLIYSAVLPVGGDNVTNDLAIGLRTDLDIAEKVKIEYAVAMTSLRKGGGIIRFKVDGETLSFPSDLVDEIVEARMEDIFRLVNDELRKIKKYANLPGGVVLTGGGCRLKGVAECAREFMQLSARVNKPTEYTGMGGKILDPAWATTVGLMLIDLDGNAMQNTSKSKKKSGSLFGKMFKK